MQAQGAGRPGVYEFRVRFRAPISFVYGWCTDYSAEDPALEGDSSGTRRVLKRTATTVVYEDLDTTPEGWTWSRWEVRLDPPTGWHGKAIGNRREWDASYQLTSLPDGGTELRFRGKRRPMMLGARNPPRRQLEKDLTAMWRKFAKSLAADYARRRPKPRKTAA